MVPVDRDATHAGDNAAKIFVVCIEFRGKDQHGVVKRELGFRGRDLPQRFNALREPVGRLLGVRDIVVVNPARTIARKKRDSFIERASTNQEVCSNAGLRAPWRIKPRGRILVAEKSTSSVRH